MLVALHRGRVRIAPAARRDALILVHAQEHSFAGHESGTSQFREHPPVTGFPSVNVTGGRCQPRYTPLPRLQA
jgi:hypothetical protein